MATQQALTTEPKSIRFIRRLIVFIVVIFVGLLGYPLFSTTTTIYRADLPISEVNELATIFQDKIHFKIPVYIDVSNSLEYFIPSCQEMIDDELYGKYPNLKDTWQIDLKRKVKETIDTEKDYVIRMNVAESFSYFISPFSKEINLSITREAHTKTVETFLKKVLLEHVFQEEIEQLDSLLSSKKETSQVVMPYSSNYNVVFSLLVENGQTLNWDIEESTKLFRPLFEKLQHFSNFSISSQIQYYSKLTKEVKYDQGRDAYVLKDSELSTFINFGDWNLVTHDIKPTINFLVYFPDSNYKGKPFLIENSDTNSFLVPQWGGVSIFNKGLPVLSGAQVTLTDDELLPVMEIFASQLFQLLGLPSTPKSPSIRIDTLSRITFFKNSKKALENLLSLIKLTQSLNEISIPENTKEYVLETISYINRSLTVLDDHQDYPQAIELSSKALENSDKAFFEKEMVQQAYFPSEHKLAVLLPLLGPVTSIITLGFLKMLVDLKTDRRNKLKTE